MQSVHNIYSVSEVNRLISEKIELDLTFQLMLIKGEIAAFNRHSSGHLYFTIQDADSKLKCVMFKSAARHLTFSPDSGQEVILQGRIAVYQKAGEYQLYVDSIYPVGQGRQREEFLALKEELSKAGYFAPEKKKKLTPYPERIALITSPTGAVYHDIERTLNERYNLAELRLFPVAVQGQFAVAEIIEAFALLTDYQPDTVILARGGGSAEDLYIFNNRELVEAIHNCPYPVITAIGHEIDITLCDLTADLSVATPTAAAIAVAESEDVIIQNLDYLQIQLTKHLKYSLDIIEQKLTQYSHVFTAYDPEQYLNHLGRGLADVEKLLRQKMCSQLDKMGLQLESYHLLLSNWYKNRLVSPVISKDGKTIRYAAEIFPDDELKLLFQDGEADVKVLRKKVN